MDQTALFYSRPSHDFRGGAFNVFAGSRRQRGGSIFGSLKNFFLPVAKNLGRSLLATGLGLAGKVANDTMQGKNFKKSLMEHGKSSAINFGKSAAQEGVNALSSMIGRGKRRARRRRAKRIHRRKATKTHSTRRRRRRTSRKAVSRKRRASSKTAHKRKAKRRRVNF